jgi:hypothetical protein
MNRLLLLITLVMFTTLSKAQNNAWAEKSLNELLMIFKEKVETYGNMLNGDISYLVSSEFTSNGYIQICENISGSKPDWYDINIAKANFGTSVQVLSTGKDNFMLSFDKSITTRRQNDKAKNLDVAFYRKKDKRDIDHKVLISDMNQLMMLMISKSQSGASASKSLNP